VKSFAEVSGLYFAQVIYPDGEPHWTVAVEFASGSAEQDLNQVITALAGETRKNLVEGRPISFLSASTPVGQSITKLGKEFFRSTK
jgi:hypothetical protein